MVPTPPPPTSCWALAIQCMDPSLITPGGLGDTGCFQRGPERGWGLGLAHSGQDLPRIPPPNPHPRQS